MYSKMDYLGRCLYVLFETVSGYPNILILFVKRALFSVIESFFPII